MERQSSLPLAALALAAGFGIGWASSSRWFAPPSTARCECGFDLTGIPPEHVERHRAGRQHQVNLHRSSGAPILVTAKVNEYRAAVATHVRPTDVILEVGCAEGLTTQRLAQCCRIAIGVDQNETLILKGKARLASSSKVDERDGSSPDWSNLHLRAGDAFDTAAILKIIEDVLGPSKTGQHGGRVNKIWLDISGSRKLETVAQLVRILEALLEPELIVVKSHHLKNLILRSYLPNSVIPEISVTPKANRSYILA